MMTLSYLWFSLDIPNLRLDVSWPMTLTYWPFTFVVLMSFNPRFRFINGCPTFQYILYFIISMFFFKFSRIVANKSYTKISQYTSLVYFFLELWDKNLLTVKLCQCSGMQVCTSNSINVFVALIKVWREKNTKIKRASNSAVG